MRIFAALLLAWITCGAPVSSDSSLSRAKNMNRDFSDVLLIAQSRAVDARERLQALAENAKDEEARLAARHILTHWNDKERTYFSTSPLPLRRACVDDAELSLVREKIDESTSIELELRITESGEVQTVTIMKGSGRRDVDGIVADSLLGRRFLPVKTGDDYRPGDLRVNCWLEVR